MRFDCKSQNPLFSDRNMTKLERGRKRGRGKEGGNWSERRDETGNDYNELNI